MSPYLYLALVVLVAVLPLAPVVRRDGLGTRTPPRSHRQWWENDREDDLRG